MANATSSVGEQIRQLNDARKLVLGDVNFYTNIVQGILPIISPSSLPPLRRWGADFLAEAFATPALPSREKETLSLLVLESLKTMVEKPDEDVHVLRSVIQAAASIYPLAMRWMYVCPCLALFLTSTYKWPAPDRINNSYDTPTWERILSIKLRILRIWDGAPPAVKICCIKFAQRVVLAQSTAASPEQKVGSSGCPPCLPLCPARPTADRSPTNIARWPRRVACPCAAQPSLTRSAKPRGRGYGTTGQDARSSAGQWQVCLP